MDIDKQRRRLLLWYRSKTVVGQDERQGVRGGK